MRGRFICVAYKGTDTPRIYLLGAVCLGNNDWWDGFENYFSVGISLNHTNSSSLLGLIGL